MSKRIMAKKHLKKTLLFLVWVAFIALAFFLWKHSGIALADVPDVIGAWVKRFGLLAPIVYIVLYVLRALTFFSATVFTIASGLIFGPVLGILYTIIAENLSALLAFSVGRYFGTDVVRWLSAQAKYFPKGEKLRENGFMSVLLMRLLFFPFDPVAYFSGAYQVRVRDFFLGTFIGTLPGLIAFVALGDVFAHPLKSLLIFFPFFIVGLVIAKLLKKTKHGKELSQIKEHGNEA